MDHYPSSFRQIQSTKPPYLLLKKIPTSERPDSSPHSPSSSSHTQPEYWTEQPVVRCTNPIDHKWPMMIAAAVAVVAGNVFAEADKKIVVGVAEVTVVADTAAVAFAEAEEPDRIHRNRQTRSALQSEVGQRKTVTRYPGYSSCSP